MTHDVVHVDGQRLIRDLKALARIGKFETGVDRPAFSAPDIEGRRWVAERMQDAGLMVEIDRYGTVLGRSGASGPAVLIGSHTDTVPRGGWLDGALGVVYGIEVVRALRDHFGDDAPAIDVVNFQDEEGTCIPCLGSRMFCGELTQGDVAGARVADGRELAQAICDSGLQDNKPLRLDARRYSGFFEAHIEQGPRLERSGNAVGIATGIVGIRRFRVAVRGRADHAGTTPMNLRCDAGAIAIAIAHALLEQFPKLAGSETVWNIGTISFEPGAANVVPAGASFIIEFRDMAEEKLAELEAEISRLAGQAPGHGEAPEVVVSELARLAPTPLDGAVSQAFQAGCEAVGAGYEWLPSGAGHDAMVLARHIPAGLMFVPSINGRSHDISENTKEADIVTGCHVMANAVAGFARKQARG